jgi:hypothetical protein
MRGPSGAAPQPAAPGAISGRVIDADGRPLAGVSVRAMLRTVGPNGQPLFLNVGPWARTDRDGRYRLANRRPDAYVVAAAAYSIDPGGRPFNMVRNFPAASPGPDGVLLGYVTTFYGGVADQRIASIVRVGADEVRDVDIQILRRPVFAVTGSITDLPADGGLRFVTIAPVGPLEQTNSLDVRHIPVRADGSFTVDEVPDGAYVLSFSHSAGWSELPIRVDGRTPAPVTMPLQPAMVVTGRVVFDGSAPPPAIVRDLQQFHVEFGPAQLTIGASFTRVPMQSDGTFSVRANGRGPFRLRAIAPAPWVQITGAIKGVDTLDLPVSAEPKPADALVVFSDRVSALLVRVRGTTDQPIPNIGVAVFSEDNRYWSGRSRRAQIMQAATGGTAVFSNLPPGRYFVAAAWDLNASTPITPALLGSLKARAQTFEIVAGESKSVEVKVN